MIKTTLAASCLWVSSLSWTWEWHQLLTLADRGATFPRPTTIRKSHTECCKGDDESLWKKGEIWPPATQKTLNRWSPKYVQITTSGISTTMQNFIQIGSGVSVLRMRDFAPLGTKWLGYFFGSWERLQPRRAHRFWRKIRQTTWFRARECLLGVAKPKSKVSTPIFPKTTILGPHFSGTEFFRPKTAFNIGRLDSKRPLIVVVAQ